MNALQNVVDYGIIGLLLALSLWTVAVAVERWLFYRRVNLAQYPSSLGLEMALTKRLVIIGTCLNQCRTWAQKRDTVRT